MSVPRLSLSDVIRRPPPRGRPGFRQRAAHDSSPVPDLARPDRGQLAVTVEWSGTRDASVEPIEGDGDGTLRQNRVTLTRAGNRAGLRVTTGDDHLKPAFSTIGVNPQLCQRRDRLQVHTTHDRTPVDHVW